MKKTQCKQITNITLKVTLCPLLTYNSGMRRPFRYKAMPHDCWPETLNIEQYKNTAHGGHYRDYNPGRNNLGNSFVTSLNQTKGSDDISTYFVCY